MAALIPEGFIQDLLTRTDLVELIRGRVPLKKSGRNFVACCPFHQEKTPSFSVAPDKQFYYCFGCGAKGDAIRFLMEYDHLAFPQAVEQLAGLAGMEVPKQQESLAQRRERSISQQIYDLLARAESYFQAQLGGAQERQKAHQYLQQRGLTPDICQQFRVGYAPPGFTNITTDLALDKEHQQLALTAGLLSENDSQRRFDKFRDRVIFPIRDVRGRVIGFGGRLLGDGKPKYLNSPETPVFHKGQELYGLWEWRQTRQPDKHLLVVEGYMDVISLAQFGIRNVVATLGTATSEAHIKKLFREVDEIIFCFDGDKAGRRAAWRALEASLPELPDDKQVRFLFLPDGEDPDTMVRGQGPESIRAACEKAQPLETFLFDQLSEELDLEQVAGRARLARLSMPYIARLKGDFYRSLLEKNLAARTGLEPAELARMQAPPASVRAPAPPTSGPTLGVPADAYYDLAPDTEFDSRITPSYHSGQHAAASRRHTTMSLGKRLLLILLEYPQLASSRPPQTELASLQLPDLALLLSAIELLKRCPASTRAQALGLFMTLDDNHTIEQLIQQRYSIANSMLAEREWHGGLLQLELLQLDASINQLRQQPRPDPLQLQQLLVERARLKQQRGKLSHLNQP